ncbi:MAG: hypothetical protein K9L78_01155 [Victivallales bacterium]|nr:hypothetical protein [Victivallales bacterium]MCF7888705.1 hypothetical protein [Victivallales bacterium]
MNFINHIVIKPEDLNHYGYLFGGKLLLWVDEYSWIAASLEFPGHNFVTKGMTKVQFKKSVSKGVILKFTITKGEQGKAYVNFDVNVYAKHIIDSEEDKLIFNTTVTFVSIDDNGRIKPLYSKIASVNTQSAKS